MSDKLRPLPGAMREYDKDVIPRWFEYRLTAEQRRALMAEHPEAYNRWMRITIALVTVFDE